MAKVIALSIVQRTGKDGVTEVLPRSSFEVDGAELDRLLAGRHVELAADDPVDMKPAKAKA